MSLTILACLAGAFVGVSLTIALSTLLPQHPNLAAALRNLQPDDLLIAPTREPDHSPTRGWRNTLGHHVHAHTGHLRGLCLANDVDLRVLDIPTSDHYATKALWAGTGLLATSATTTALGIGITIPFVVGLIVAAVCWFLPDLRIRRQAHTYREDFAYAAVSYLRLVAINRQASIGITAAMELAAQTSDAWMWVRIREELTLARWRGVTPWDALAQLSQQIDVPELREVADIVRLTESGANVTANLMSRAASLRDRLLTKETTAANEATQAMQIPLAGLAGVFLMALLLPAVLRLAGI